MINEWLESLSTLITQRMWLAPLLALFTGVHHLHHAHFLRCHS
jgi:hypothetical protein